MRQLLRILFMDEIVAYEILYKKYFVQKFDIAIVFLENAVENRDCYVGIFCKVFLRLFQKR